MVGDGIPDLKPFNTDQGADLSGLHFVDLLLLQPFKHHQLFDAALFQRHTVPFAKCHRLPGFEFSAGQLADGDPANQGAGAGDYPWSYGLNVRPVRDN